MNNTEQIIKWMKSICEEPPETFSAYFLDDVKDYLCIDDIDKEGLKRVCGKKYDDLLKCQTKEEVEAWLCAITSYVVMKMQTGDIIRDYLEG